MKIECWSVQADQHDPYKTPELQAKHLVGLVYGHALFEDGAKITSSAIAKIQDGKVVTQGGSVYELGEVDPRYEAMYHGAKARLLAMETK